MNENEALESACLTDGLCSCCYCGGPAEGNYAIHDTPEMDGPELDLCNAHGSQPLPTCDEIWARIAAQKGTR